MSFSNHPWVRGLPRMDDDPRPSEKPDDDDRRTEEAKRVAEDHANGLRERLQKLRRWFS